MQSSTGHYSMHQQVTIVFLLKIVCTGVKFKSYFNVDKNHINRFLLLYVTIQKKV